jgi:hypothetical protein
MGDYTEGMVLRRSPAVFVFVFGWTVLLLPGVPFGIVALVYGWYSDVNGLALHHCQAVSHDD